MKDVCLLRLPFFVLCEQQGGIVITINQQMSSSLANLKQEEGDFCNQNQDRKARDFRHFSYTRSSLCMRMDIQSHDPWISKVMNQVVIASAAVSKWPEIGSMVCDSRLFVFCQASNSHILVTIRHKDNKIIVAPHMDRNGQKKSQWSVILA